MYIIRATYEDFLSVSRIVKLIGCSRQAIETMIKECEEANWIKVKEQEKSAEYKA